MLLALGHLLIFARTDAGEHVRPYSDYWFAAVWFGYIFIVDAIIQRRDGRSLIVDHTLVFLLMLPLSAVVWWGFEWVNELVQNWHYRRPYDIPEWYATLISLVFFSTVIPAVWVTTDLVSGSSRLQQLPPLRDFSVPHALPPLLIALGVVSFILPAVWPLYFFPLIWGFASLILDPINYLRGAPSILEHWSRGDWRTPLALALAGLICGFFWEFWNYWAFPQWYYTVPFVGFLKIFEMPLLGYLGYIPFAWELYAFFWFAASFVRGNRRLYSELDFFNRSR